MTGDQPTRSERYEANTRRLMAERAALLPIWQYRETRRGLLPSINNALDAYLVAREFDGYETEFECATPESA